MKYYKHLETEQVYAYENEQERQRYGAPELVEMTPAEVEQHLNPPPVPPTEEEIRARRDALLTECDWVVVRAQELGESVAPEWTNYRQALRDVPQQSGFPEGVDWPSEPDRPAD